MNSDTTLDFDFFLNYFDRLVAVFHPKDPSRMIAPYFESLSYLTNERFQQVCNAAIGECEQMPKPAWLIAKAIEVANRDEIASKVLPFAEPVTGGQCPPHVRRWLQEVVPANRADLATLATARRSAFARLSQIHRVSTGRHVQGFPAALLAEIEKDSGVIAARRAIGANQRTIADVEAAIDEGDEFSYEFSFVDEAVDAIGDWDDQEVA